MGNMQLKTKLKIVENVSPILAAPIRFKNSSGWSVQSALSYTALVITLDVCHNS
mgnify:CR=1 FL=1